MRQYGYDPQALGLTVTKLRPNGHYNCFCPYMNHERPSADFDPISGTFFCYNCKERANVWQLAYHLGGTIKRIFITPPEPNEKQNAWKELANLEIALTNEYLQKRNIYPETILEFNIKADSDGVYFPIYEDNKLIGIQQRRSFSSRNKYIFYGKFTPVYPLDKLKTLKSNEPIILVEGIFGALKGFQNNKNVFCTFGTNPNKQIAKALSGFSNILICYDDDFAGYNGAANLLKLIPQAKVLVPGREMDEISSAEWNNLNNFETTKSYSRIMNFVEEEKLEIFKNNLIRDLK